MTQVAVKPPTFVIFVNDKQLMHFSYQRYIENKIREAFGFKGTPIRIIIKDERYGRKDMNLILARIICILLCSVFGLFQTDIIRKLYWIDIRKHGSETRNDKC
jgi:hypothetical protein